MIENTGPGQQSVAAVPHLACCLFLQIKFDYSTATLTDLQKVCGYLRCIAAESNSWDRDHMALKAESI